MTALAKLLLVVSSIALFTPASALALSKARGGGSQQAYTQDDFQCGTCCNEYNTHGDQLIPLTPARGACKGKHHQCEDCWDAWRQSCNAQHQPFNCPVCRANLNGVPLARDENRMRAKDQQGALERTQGIREELRQRSAETARAFEFRKFDRDIVFDNTLEAKYIIDNSSSMGDNDDAKIIYLCEHTQEVKVIPHVTRWAETLVSLRGHLMPENTGNIFGGVVGHNITRGILAHYYALNQKDPSKGWQQDVDVVTIDAARNNWEESLEYFQQKVKLLDETILATKEDDGFLFQPQAAETNEVFLMSQKPVFLKGPKK
jgi:hypothetical protein